MPDRSYANQSPGEHAKQQMNALSQAVSNAAREVDRAYPNTQRGDHIVRDFRQQTNRILQNGRQQRNRSLAGSYSQPARAGSFPVGFVLGLLLLLIVACLYGLFLYFLAESLSAPLWVLLLISLVTNFLLVWALCRDVAAGAGAAIGGLLGYVAAFVLM